MSDDVKIVIKLMFHRQKCRNRKMRSKNYDIDGNIRVWPCHCHGAIVYQEMHDRERACRRKQTRAIDIQGPLIYLKNTVTAATNNI